MPLEEYCTLLVESHIKRWQSGDTVAMHEILRAEALLLQCYPVEDTRGLKYLYRLYRKTYGEY